MTPVIYSSSAAPWKSGGSQVDQYESGLIKVTQEYMCPTSERETIALLFAQGNELTGITSPAEDGLYIYPEPNYADEGNGLTKISVTAYGRKIEGYSVETTFITRALDYTDIDDITTRYVLYLPSYRVKWVMREGESLGRGFFDTLKNRDDIFRIDLSTTRVTKFAERRREFEFNASPSNGFGIFQEQVFNLLVVPYGTE